MIIIAMSSCLAVILDWLFGEVKRWHPLVGFGKLANGLEKTFNKANQPDVSRFLFGGVAWLLAVIPLTLLSIYLSQIAYFGILFNVVVLYFCIGHRSLYDHVTPIIQALTAGDCAKAQYLASRIVSRDPDSIEVEKASIESVLENGNDAIFGALFWFFIFGAPGAFLYRLANTLDAMWGYKTPQFLYFGKVAARMDDLLNLLPARLTALSYALLGNTRLALRCWFTQAKQWDSPNAGPVMASGAGALNCRLGGTAIYHGRPHHRAQLGSDLPATVNDISRALHLVTKTVGLWCLVFVFFAGVAHA